MNPYRGDVALVLDGESHCMRLTLGALAELEEALGADSMLALVERFENGAFSASDLISLLLAGLRGDWAGHDGEVAVQANGGWVFMVPKLGWRGWDETTGEAVVYDGVSWQSDAVVASAGGAGTHWRMAEIDHLILAGADTTTVNVIPNGAQVIGVTGRVISAISGTGIASWQLGVAGSINRYGSGLGLGLNSWAKGLSGQPQTYYADTPLLLTPDAGTFGAGTVRLCVHYVELSVPRSV